MRALLEAFLKPVLHYIMRPNRKIVSCFFHLSLKLSPRVSVRLVLVCKQRTIDVSFMKEPKPLRRTLSHKSIGWYVVQSYCTCAGVAACHEQQTPSLLTTIWVPLHSPASVSYSTVHCPSADDWCSITPRYLSHERRLLFGRSAFVTLGILRDFFCVKSIPVYVLKSGLYRC